MYIALEGIDHCGKTTQINLLKEWASNNCWFVREPSDSFAGQMIRAIASEEDVEQKQVKIELEMLFATDRSFLYRHTILPALKQGYRVISDRSMISSLAYQNLTRAS